MPAAPASLRILSIDHGAHDLEPLALAVGADPRRIPAFKHLAVQAASRVAAGRSGYGMFLDAALGADALPEAAKRGLWLARQFPHGDRAEIARFPEGWPGHHVVKLIANGRKDSAMPLAARLDDMRTILPRCRDSRHAILVEALPGENETTASFIASLQADGFRADWWLVECQRDEAAYHALADTMDSSAEGAIVIARNAEAGPELRNAARMPRIRGFVGGRSIFGEALKAWHSGAYDDDAAVSAMAQRFSTLAEAFDSGREE